LKRFKTTYEARSCVIDTIDIVDHAMQLDSVLGVSIKRIQVHATSGLLQSLESQLRKLFPQDMKVELVEVKLDTPLGRTSSAITSLEDIFRHGRK
jgi:hypothetical protein